MPSGFNYSKWDNIELSDDEDDLHPNIDKESWFRMKHRMRTEKEEDDGKNKIQLEKDLATLKSSLATFGAAGQNHKKALKLKVDIKTVEDKLEYMEKHKKWNADNMCKTSEDRVIISDPKPVRELPSDPSAGYVEFVEAHEDILEKYIAMGQEWNDEEDPDEYEKCRDFLHVHGDLFLEGEHAEFYLMLDCLEKEMNGFHGEMRKSARQGQLLVHLRELARSIGRPPRDAVYPMFEKLINREDTRQAFVDAVEDFIKRVEKRAVVKKKEMDAEREAEEPNEIGPGGLDPMEVLESLPKDMQDAFENQDLVALHKAVGALPAKDARYHMQRCEDSGLWVPGPGETPPYRQE